MYDAEGIRMELRKLIAFGKATYSITLPKKWVKENALVKGDLILVQEKSPEKLEISPKLTDQQELIKETTLQVTNKTLEEIKIELISAYINDYSVINLIGDLRGKVGQVRDMLNELIGLEIMEVSNNKIMAKVFSDVTNTHVHHIIRRISLITKTMFDDLQSVFHQKGNQEPLAHSDMEINRQTFFATRVLTKAIKSAYFRGSIKMELTETVFALKVIDYQERIADNLKNVARYCVEGCIMKKTSPAHTKKIISFLEQIDVEYDHAIKAYVTKDKKLALDVVMDSNDMRAKLREYMKNNCVMPVPYFSGTLSSLSQLIADLAMTVYNSEF